ncbi:MAG: hypothetical protein U9N59_04620 [Campylobacterota bacterium]|nr:hypothetical protein [Campylobacterota bacterium]
MATAQKQSTSNIKTILILVLVIAGLFFYWNSTKDSLDETYTIKSAGSDEGGYRASFINRTGKDVEDKKINLSDDYWTGGKFGF